MVQSTHALVAGGGPAGLATAILLARESLETVLVTPATNAADPRTVALMAPALQLLQNIGVWPGQISALSAPLRHLEILDDTGGLVQATPLRFSASELGIDSFGWNIPLSALVDALVQVAQTAGVQFVEGRAAHVTHEPDRPVVALEDGRQFSAQLLVAADGKNSLLRQAAGIATQSWTLQQSALVATFSHSGPHHACSTERHRAGGPLTTVPLPGRRSSLVWMDHPNAVARLMEKPADLAVGLQLATHGQLGRIGDISALRAFPMEGLKAERFASQRTFLVGEAAHAFPPIGAQGLNLSLRDAGHLADTVRAHGGLGSDAAMADYHERRWRDVNERLAAVMAMNQSLLSDLLPLHVLRSGAAAVLNAFPPLRHLAMRKGLGFGSPLPSVMTA